MKPRLTVGGRGRRYRRQRVSAASAAATLSLIAVLGVAMLGPDRAAAQAPGPAAASTGTSPALFNREIYGYTSQLTVSAEAHIYNVIVLAPTDAGVIPFLHYFNPNVKVLLYQGIERASVNSPQVCTDATSDLQSHSNWFLRNSAGQPVYTAAIPPNTPASYHMDVGVPGYQQACIAHALALAKQGGFNGIFLDGVDSSINYQFRAPYPSIPKYARTSAWQAAMYSFLQYAGPTVRGAGMLLIGNIGGADTPLWSQWNGPLSGAEEEAWTDAGGGLSSWLWWWPKQLANLDWSEAHGKLALVHSHNVTAAGNTYGLASMLLVANGHSSYSTANANYFGDERWFPTYPTAMSLGAATGAYVTRSNGVYQRRFANGIVLVNPSLTRSSSFSLGGYYTGSGLTHVNSVSMAPTSALILLPG